jgi:hypothetical protein
MAKQQTEQKGDRNTARGGTENAQQAPDTPDAAETVPPEPCRGQRPRGGHESCCSKKFIKRPDIRVLITGLQALSFQGGHQPGPYTSCEVKALNAPGHEFRIFIDRISRCDGTVARYAISSIGSSIRARCNYYRYGKFAYTRQATPQISLVIDPVDTGCVTKFMVDPFDGDRLEREAFDELSDGSILGSDDPRDYRWVVDFEGPDFHSRRVGFDESAIASRVNIPRGQFYTAVRTPQAFERVIIQRRGRPFPLAPVGTPTEAAYGAGRLFIGRIARVIGANINLNDGEHASLQVRPYCPGCACPCPPSCPPPPDCSDYPDLPDCPDRPDYCYCMDCESGCDTDILYKFEKPEEYAYKVAFVNLHAPGADPALKGGDFVEYGHALQREPTSIIVPYDLYDLEPVARVVSDAFPCGPLHGGSASSAPPGGLRASALAGYPSEGTNTTAGSGDPMPEE